MTFPDSNNDSSADPFDHGAYCLPDLSDAVAVDLQLSAAADYGMETVAPCLAMLLGQSLGSEPVLAVVL